MLLECRDLSIIQSIDQSINLAINQRISQSVSLPGNQSIFNISVPYFPIYKFTILKQNHNSYKLSGFPSKPSSCYEARR